MKKPSLLGHRPFPRATGFSIGVAFIALNFGLIAAGAQNLPAAAPPAQPEIAGHESGSLAGAAFRGDIDAAKRILEAGGKPDVIEASARPLQIAAEHGRDRILTLLLEHGADIDAVDSMGDTALAWAAANGHTGALHVLIDHGAAINHQNLDGWTPLWWALACRQTETAKLLVEAGADVKERDKEGLSALAFSVPLANSDLLELLLKKGADPTVKTDRGFSAFAAAAAENSVDTLRLLIEYTKPGAAQNDLLGDALHWAAEYGRLDVVRFLVSSTKVDIHRQLDDSFGGVIALGGPDAPEKQGFTALSRAADGGYAEILRFLLENGARVEGRTRSGDPLLSYAIKRKRSDWVELFLSKKPPLDAVDFQGRTALMVTSESGDLELTRRLLGEGASPSKQDLNGMSALHLAARQGQTSIVSALLAAGVSPLTADKAGKTPREYAVIEGHHDTADLLATAEQQAAKKGGDK